MSCIQLVQTCLMLSNGPCFVQLMVKTGLPYHMIRPFEYQTAIPSCFQTNPVCACPVFESLLYSCFHFFFSFKFPFVLSRSYPRKKPPRYFPMQLDFVQKRANTSSPLSYPGTPLSSWWTGNRGHSMSSILTSEWLLCTPFAVQYCLFQPVDLRIF